MERKDYRPRLIDNIIDSYLEAFGAVCVEEIGRASCRERV